MPLARTGQPRNASVGWKCSVCSVQSAPWAKTCATCMDAPPKVKASSAPWRTRQAGGQQSPGTPVYQPPDPDAPARLAERMAIAEQLKVTKNALAVLGKLGPQAFPEARASLQKQLETLQRQKASKLSPLERLRAARDAANSAR